MAWYLNHYHCARCEASWQDEWSCACDDECPVCGHDISPDDSDDLSVCVTEADNGTFIISRSSYTAEDRPDYGDVLIVNTRKEADDYLTDYYLAHQ